MFYVGTHKFTWMQAILAGKNKRIKLMNYWILTFEFLIMIAVLIVLIRPNWFLKIFVHKQNSYNHFPIETYTGMTVIGYTCHGCGYRWYEKRKTNKKLKEEK
jgi:hypothetical protein